MATYTNSSYIGVIAQCRPVCAYKQTSQAQFMLHNWFIFVGKASEMKINVFNRINVFYCLFNGMLSKLLLLFFAAAY